MKRKINRYFMVITAAAIMITAVVSTILFFIVLKEQVFADLKAYGHIIRQTEPADLKIEEEEMRVTWILKDGSVLYDSQADESSMENHRERPEVKKAKRYGMTTEIRWSKTLSVHTFYYAERLEDGSVLRIAKRSGSILKVMANAVMIVLAISFLTFLLCAFTARFLTKRIAEPMERMADNLTLLDTSDVYEEIRPFVSTIKDQHIKLLNHAKMRQEIEQREISTQQFIQQVIEEHFTEKGGQISMAVRTVAVQVSEELFARLKAAVAKKGCRQKDFLIELIEKAIEEIEAEFGEEKAQGSPAVEAGPEAPPAQRETGNEEVSEPAETGSGETEAEEPEQTEAGDTPEEEPGELEGPSGGEEPDEAEARETASEPETADTEETGLEMDTVA